MLSIPTHYVLYARNWLFPHLLIQDLWSLLLWSLLWSLLRSLLLWYLRRWSLLLSPLPPAPTLPCAAPPGTWV